MDQHTLSSQSIEERAAFQVNVTQLRADSFRTILLLTAGIGWLWFSWASWPRSHGEILFYSDAWIISVLLLVLVLLSYLLQLRHIYAGIMLFIVGLVALLSGQLQLFKSAEVAYLYLLPIMFSSVLLGQTALLLVSGTISVWIVGISQLDAALSIGEFVPALFTMLLTAVAISISTSNLQIALAWTLNGYRQAHENELLARERKAQLEHAFKSLDKAMSKLQRTNLRLREVSVQAEEARRLKQQFAQTISHELRTPLNLIAGFTENMIKSPEYYGGMLPPNYLRDLSVVYRNACHLQDLVNDVLDLARLEAAYLSLQSEELDLATLIQDAVDTARRLVEGRGLALRTEICADLPPVWGDAVRLKQVILNLLNNAARFTEQGSVTVRVGAEDEHVIVGVQDTGIGIPEDHLTQVFEAFRQLENPMQRRTEGAGLGLAISQQLITLHGGQLWAESEVGVGSTFYFSLPVKQIETINLERSTDTSVIRVPASDRRSKPLALIITRSPSSAALLSRHLGDYRIITITELDHAPTAIRQLLPQVVIIDSSTEPVDEHSLAGLHAPDLGQVAVITCPLPGEEPLRQQLNADGYLIKPITREGLWDTLRQFNESLNRVLIVDDDRDFVRLISRMLAKPVLPNNIMYAYSGQEALDIISHTPPDIVFLDLNLPDMNGARVIQHIRSIPAFATMRVVVITAYEDIDSANMLPGSLTITKGSGWRSNDLVYWLQVTLETMQGKLTALS